MRIPPKMPFYSLFFPILAITLIGCDRTGPRSETMNVFGTDERTTTPDTAPYRAVGRFDVGCTGTLIGKRLVLTAAHCVIDSATSALKTDMTFFRPNFRNGASAEAIWVDHFWLGSEKPEDSRLKDWAIVRLEKEPATPYGSLPVQPQPVAELLPYTTNLVGYSSDLDHGNNPSLSPNCQIHEIIDGKFFHDCDATAGVSGGPLLDFVNGAEVIVGMTVSEYRQGAADSVHRDAYSKDYANVAVPADEFAATAKTLLATADSGGTTPQIAGVVDRTNTNQRPADPNGHGGVIYGAAKVQPVAQLQAAQTALRHITGDLILGSHELSTFVATLSATDLKAITSSLDVATHQLETTIGLAVDGRLGSDCSNRVFENYRSVKSPSVTLAGYSGITDPAQHQRLQDLVSRITWLVAQFESYAFVH